MHDLRTFVGQLRDHLAAHDRPVAFLFGAGTSSAIRVAGAPLIPAIAAMTSACKTAVEACGPLQREAWRQLVNECTNLNLQVNIESILSRIRSKLEAVVGADTISGLDRAAWSDIDAVIRKEIVRLTAPADTAIPPQLPHHDFAQWVRNATRRQPIEVFTTNYDVLFERAFDQLRVPHFDGFIGSQHPYFSAESIEDDGLLPPAHWVRYWKLHGSVTWTFENVAGEQRITRGSACTPGELILPSHRKYDESRKEPYRSLMDRLARVLAREDAYFVTCGYSFGDQHINAIILDALDQHQRTHLLALSYSDISEDSQLATWATARPNIMQVGPNAAVLAGRFGKWSVPGTPDAQLTEATGGLVEGDTSDPTKPRLLAGDFASFARFLKSFHRGRP